MRLRHDEQWSAMNGTRNPRSDARVEVGVSAETQTMPLAIVGMACRFAGGISSPEKLWDLVSQGRDAWSTIPETRFNQPSFYDEQRDKTGTTHIRGGYFLDEDVGLFDPSFFNFSAEVAAAMDPQVRMLLELTFESFESAGIPLQDIMGSNTSVFAGTFTKDYHDQLLADSMNTPRGFITGNYAAMVPNRISHFFDLKGPSTAVDTGCSTSLMGLHLACQSLRSRESDCAVVGGSCINLNPGIFANLSTLGSCGPDGKCYAFDHRAQGYGRGEGVAALIVKRLDDAIRNGDPIRAVIRETGINQDGRSPTITSPDRDAQYDLIRACYAKAGLDPLATSVVEAHGTGTSAGDPVEAEAIGRALRDPKRSRQTQETPLYMASVKTNLGHTEAVSGLASVIKMVKSLEHGKIAPSINFEKPNPAIDFDGLSLKIPLELCDWPSGRARRASINNFGFGGTNAHVILDGAPRTTKDQRAMCQPHTPKLFLLSAHDEKTLRRMAADLTSHLDQYEEMISLSDLAYTLGQRRTKFDWSLAASARSISRLSLSLSDETIRPVQASGGSQPRLGFVFNGQGAQWFAMGRELMNVYPTYLKTLQECDEAIASYGSKWSLIDELRRDKDQSRVDQVRFSMPLTCAVQISLVRLLEEWGVHPASVTGHSTGEVAAAFAAGAISLSEAMAVTFYRGLINSAALEDQALPLGGMMAVGLGPDQVEPYINSSDCLEKVTIACFNSPSSVTLSGDMDAIVALGRQFGEQGIFSRTLKVEAAFHSHHMMPLAEAYRTALQEHMDNRDNRSFIKSVQFVSPVTGAPVRDANELGPSHWVENMLRPVQFTNAFHCMIFPAQAQRRNVDVVIEIGAHSALGGPIRQLLGEPATRELGITYVSCLERGRDAVETMQGVAGRLIQDGYPVDISRVNFPGGTDTSGHAVIPDLPSYPWNHSTRFWAEPRASHEHRFRKHSPHELIGTRVPGLSDQLLLWRNILRCSDTPWMRDHVVQSQIVYPGAGYIAMAVEAARQMHAESSDTGKAILGYTLRDVEICKALIVPDDSDGVEVQISLELPDERLLVGGWRRFRVRSAPDRASPWDDIASGLIAVQLAQDGTAEKDRAFALRATAEKVGTPPRAQRYRSKLQPRDLFQSLRGLGVHHGPLFQNLEGEIMLAEGKSLTTLKIADTGSAKKEQRRQPPVIHPTTLDSVFLAAYPSLHVTSGGPSTVGAAVPRSIKTMYISSDISTSPGRQLEAYSVLRQHNKNGFSIAALVQPAQTSVGTPLPVIEIEDMRFQSLGHVDDDDDGYHKKLCLVTDWKRSFALNSPASLVQDLHVTAPEDEKQTGHDLVRAAFYLISDTLAQLTAQDIAKLEWHHKRLHTWMKRLVAQAANNELAPYSARWASSSEGIQAMLIDRVEGESVNGALSVRIGKHLLGIMRQEVAPLELMLREQLLYAFYQRCLHFPRSTAQAAALVRAMAEENPRLRILEIGAGTGGCTIPVLHALRDSRGQRLFEQYTFTDISMGFFKTARETLAAWGEAVSYATLDIEQDPQGQGFEEASYDVIIAAQVLHATKCMKTTMGHVRKLLKPESGRLVMIETTRDTAEMHVIFGVLPGWWLSEEPEREYSPTMSLDAWEKCLASTGFNGIDASVWDCDDQSHATMSCILSSVAADPQPLPIESATLVHDGSAPSLRFARILVDSFARDMGIVLAVEPLSTLVPEGKTCIFLSGIDGSAQSFDETIFYSIRELITRCKSLLWVTAGSAVDCEIPENALHLGLLRTARVEDTSRRYVSLDLDPLDALDEQTAQHIAHVFRKTMDWNHNDDDTSALDVEYAVRNQALLVPRVHLDGNENDALLAGLREKAPEMQEFARPGRSLRMYVDSPGLLDSIVFREDPDARLPLPEGWIEVEPRAYGLNFRDIMGAMGMLKEDKQEMGVECAGVVTRIAPAPSQSKQQQQQQQLQNPLQVGDRVCCLTVNGHYANRVRIPWTSAAKIPPSMSFETAASFPLAFVTAWHSLFEAGRAEPGDTVLIHAATGGVGQACLLLCQWKGIDVLVTAGTDEKREFLVKEYGIPDDHVFSSRNDSFVQGVLTATGGRGVDVVVNSLTGNLLHESWNLLAPYGRFVEIGKRDIQTNKALEMEPFQKALSFIHVDVKQMCDTRGAVIQRELQQVVSLVGENTIPSIRPVVAMPLSQASRAFRNMQAGKHIGKMVLVVEPDGLVKTIEPPQRASLPPNATYMVVGGLSGIGYSVARWLVEHGARHLLLVSRNAASRAEGAHAREELTAEGADVMIQSCDVGDVECLRRVIEKCRAAGMPEIRGVVYGGMVLDDAILEHMTFSQWNTALTSKLHGTRNIHSLLGPSLSFLILLSSACGVLGNASQANYAAGNTYQDALARHRSARGLAAVTIDLGVVDSVGFVSDNKDQGAFERLLQISGHAPLSEAEVLGLVDYAVRNPRRRPGTAQITAGISGAGRAAKMDARFGMLQAGTRRGPSTRTQSGPGAGPAVNGGLVSMSDAISHAASADEAAEAVQQAIVAKVSDMFARPEKEIDPERPLAHYGVDSLVAVELRNWLVPSARVEMSIFELLGSGSLRELAGTVVRRVRPQF